MKIKATKAGKRFFNTWTDRFTATTGVFTLTAPAL
jgi:hypothetical protein